MNNSIKLGFKLLTITAVVALGLGLANNLTEPVIAERKAKELAESLEVVYPADDYEQIDVDAPESIKNVYKAIDGSGEGYVVQIDAPGGYGGSIEFLIGVGPDNNITGFAPLTHSESAGFGADIVEDYFKEGVAGVSLDNEVGSSDSGSESEIVAITGATISTDTIVRGINDAREVLANLR